MSERSCAHSSNSIGALVVLSYHYYCPCSTKTCTFSTSPSRLTKLNTMSAAFATPFTLIAARPRALCNRCRVQRRLTPRLSSSSPPPPPPPPSEKNGNNSEIDWNESWAKFRSSGMVSDAPVGRAPPTEAEKAARKAKATLDNVQNSLPTWQILSGDWRFWVSIIFVLSLFTAYVNSTHTGIPPAATGGGAGLI